MPWKDQNLACWLSFYMEPCSDPTVLRRHVQLGSRKKKCSPNYWFKKLEVASLFVILVVFMVF